MKKWIPSALIISSIFCAPHLRADSAPDDTTDAIVGDQGISLDDTNEDVGTPVGQGSDEGAKAARNRRWQNIAIAAGAVAIAVTALILVANNDGHK
ncbi:MAG: hypothetical protein V4492_08870 [Chlamydiota bacterium]